MKKKLVILLTLVIALLVVMAFTPMSFAALTVSCKLEAQTLATTNPIADQGQLANLVIKDNGSEAVSLEKQAPFKRENADQPVLMIVSKKSRALADDSGNMVVRRDNAFIAIISADYYYRLRPVNAHNLVLTQEAPVFGNQMKKPTGLDNGFFL